MKQEMVTLEWREVTDMTRVEATDLICWLKGDDNNSVPGSAEGGHAGRVK